MAGSRCLRCVDKVHVPRNRNQVTPSDVLSRSRWEEARPPRAASPHRRDALGVRGTRRVLATLDSADQRERSAVAGGRGGRDLRRRARDERPPRARAHLSTASSALLTLQPPLLVSCARAQGRWQTCVHPPDRLPAPERVELTLNHVPLLLARDRSPTSPSRCSRPSSRPLRPTRRSSRRCVPSYPSARGRSGAQER